MSFYEELEKKFNNSITKNVSLSNYSWFNLGGPAEYLFKPKNKKELLQFLQKNKKNKQRVTILGAGSNTLIRDNGVKGVVVKLGPSFSKIKLIDKNTLEVGAATFDSKVSNFAKENCIGGFEFLSCIPGSIGGAVIMNSGCYGHDISKILVSINTVDLRDCKEKEIMSNEINFYYRGSNLSNDLIITSVKLKGKIAAQEEIEKIQKNMIEKKKDSQPSKIKTCGSTFKNLANSKHAWELIKESGCDEFQEGDAIISKKHCNFFINNGNATSSDIERLINRVKKTVNEKTGVNLELEIKIIGE